MKLNNLQQGQIYLGNKRISEIYIGSTKVFPYNEDIVFLDWVKFMDSTWVRGPNDSTPEGQEDFLDNPNIFIRPDIRPHTINIRVTMVFDLYHPSDRTFFGTRKNYNDGEYRAGSGGGYGGRKSIDFNSYCSDRSGWHSGYRYDTLNPHANVHGFHTLEAVSNKLYLDGNVFLTCGRSGYYTQVRPWCPFGGLGVIKETSMWVEGNLIYHYVPVRKGNKYGLYDLISGHFFGKETYIGGYDNNIVW